MCHAQLSQKIFPVLHKLRKKIVQNSLCFMRKNSAKVRKKKLHENSSKIDSLPQRTKTQHLKSSSSTESTVTFVVNLKVGLIRKPIPNQIKLKFLPNLALTTSFRTGSLTLWASALWLESPHSMHASPLSGHTSCLWESWKHIRHSFLDLHSIKGWVATRQKEHHTATPTTLSPTNFSNTFSCCFWFFSTLSTFSCKFL